MKLSEYAKQIGICYRTAWNMFNNNQIPNAYQLPTGTIIVPNDIISDQQSGDGQKTKEVCIYARVSSNKQKQDLQRQIKRIEQYCTANGWQIKKTFKEIASGLNDQRPQLIKMINNIDNFDLIVVEHKDRLTRIGFNYFETFYPNKFHVINETKNKEDDLMQDLVAIVTSFCARLYGQRKGKRKTEKIINTLKSND